MASALRTRIRQRNTQLQAAMQAEVEAILVEAQHYHQNAVRTWKDKPRFVLRVRPQSGVLGGQLLVTGDHQDKWKWVDKGTGTWGPTGSSYPIYPLKPGGKLIFQTNYQPRTRPLAKANVGPGVATGTTVAVDFVMHPGIKPREFTKTYVAKILRPTFKPRIVKAIQRAKPL